MLSRTGCLLLGHTHALDAESPLERVRDQFVATVREWWPSPRSTSQRFLEQVVLPQPAGARIEAHAAAVWQTQRTIRQEFTTLQARVSSASRPTPQSWTSHSQSKWALRGIG